MICVAPVGTPWSTTRLIWVQLYGECFERASDPADAEEVSHGLTDAVQ